LLPPPGTEGWDSMSFDEQARDWVRQLDVYFKASPHLGMSEAMALNSFNPDGPPPLEQARNAVLHRVERLAVLIQHFGGERT
jgi:hypothetical protein